MKYYLKFMWAAFFCGILYIFGFSVIGSNLPASDIVYLFGMYNISYFSQYLPEITSGFIPLLFFQIFFGTYIYRHFCTASVYFFSRYTHRTKWLFSESLNLFFFGCMYLFVMLLSGLIICSVISKIQFDMDIWKAFLYYISIYSLYLFVTTFGINLLSIVFNSSTGFIAVESINLFSIAAFATTGNFFAPEGSILPKYRWILKINPFYYLVFGMRNTEDFLTSILLFAGIAVLLMICSYFVVNKHNFIESNKETGGI